MASNVRFCPGKRAVVYRTHLSCFIARLQIFFGLQYVVVISQEVILVRLFLLADGIVVLFDCRLG